MKDRKNRPRKTYKQRRREKKIKKLIVVLLAISVLGAGAYVRYRQREGLIVIALDAGHGGNDPGASGIVQEPELTEQTVANLEKILKEDGRFRVVLSRDYGETKGITARRETLLKAKPKIVLSVHANADNLGQGTGFECFPSPPGRENYEKSYQFARILAEEMAAQGSQLRGIGGVRFGYYMKDEAGNTIKRLIESNDTTVYEYSSFGMVEHIPCPAVLVEQCFVTNQQDVNAFGTKEGSLKAAQAYYKAICRYLELPEKV